MQIVVLDTTKVQIFKQITTTPLLHIFSDELFQIPQRYRFSSKSQPISRILLSMLSCFRYHKGTDFQANHNKVTKFLAGIIVVLDTTKVQIFKQITTYLRFPVPQVSCFRYHKGTDFQANHNSLTRFNISEQVVLDTTKVQIFKQITTQVGEGVNAARCFRYHKGTDFQANHNKIHSVKLVMLVVLDTTKVQIFKQITTCLRYSAT